MIFGVLQAAARGNMAAVRLATVAMILAALAVAVFGGAGALGAEEAVERGLVILALLGGSRMSILLVVRTSVVVVRGAAVEAGQRLELSRGGLGGRQRGGLMLSVDLAEDIVLGALQEAIHVGMRLKLVKWAA